MKKVFKLFIAALIFTAGVTIAEYEPTQLQQKEINGLGKPCTSTMGTCDLI